jgi:hypothetical protein
MRNGQRIRFSQKGLMQQSSIESKLDYKNAT